MSNINNETNDHYIYLLQEREFIKTNEPIYKIGKTKKSCLTRLQNYPKGTMLIFQIKCKDCDTYEKILISIFKEKFIQHKNVGNEYFMGNYFEMINVIYNLIWERDIKEGIDNTNNNTIHNTNHNTIDNTNNNTIYNTNHNTNHNTIHNTNNNTNDNTNDITNDNTNDITNDNKCNKCNKILSSNVYLKRHLLICKGVSNPFECHFCHKILSDRSSKCKHLKTCKNKNISSNISNNIITNINSNNNSNNIITTINSNNTINNNSNNYISYNNLLYF